MTPAGSAAETTASDHLGFSGSYDPADVTFLLTPVAMPLTSVEEKERLIQSGARHYSEMLSPERPPGPEYMALYRSALARNGARLAHDIARLAAALAQRPQGRPEVVLASLARAGTPIGVLLLRALRRLNVRAVHYSISIIRDRGVDPAALDHIAARHAAEDVVFVDGWTGKGVIAGELRRSGAWGGRAPYLAVVADPAGAADLAATADDYVIPSGLLNAIASGLVSRSLYDPALVAAGRFHGCVRLDGLAAQDVSRSYIDALDQLRPATPVAPALWSTADRAATAAASKQAVSAIGRLCGVSDVNRIKPGIAEATRALLRRVPDRLFLADATDPDLDHLRRLATELGVSGRDPRPARTLPRRAR
jgi:hypothetical protein